MTTFTLTKFCGIATIATLGMLASSSALACHSYDVPCKIRQAADRAKDAAEKAAADAKKAADQAAADAKRLADQTAADAAPLTKTAINDIKNTAITAYKASDSAVLQGYNQSVSAINSVIDDALRALLLAAGKAGVNNSKQELTKLHTRMYSLDVQGKAALNRLVKAIGAKKFDASANADMKLLGQELGFLANAAGQNIPGNITHSSWGISLDVGAQAGVGGDVSYALAMNVLPESDGSYKSAFIESGGVSLGLAAGGGATISIFWAPGTVDQQGGPSIGFNYELAGALPVAPDAPPAGAGLDIALSWSVPTTSLSGMKAAAAAVPGMSIGYTDGIAVKFQNISAGYSFVVTSFKF